MPPKPISALACYAFDALAAEFEQRPIHALSSFQEALNEPMGDPGVHPLFVTWNTISHHDADLRGCIGTFSPLGLEKGIPEYSLIAANEDHRFEPIAKKELPYLECGVTVLRDFEKVSDPFDWQVGTHGVKANFPDGRNATFLPSVAPEQGWDKLTTLVHLAQKAGLRVSQFEDIEGQIELTRYKGESTAVKYRDYSYTAKGIYSR